MRYEIAQANRLGNRQANQDRFTAVESAEGVLLVLADGMGGHSAGELAAEALVDTARDAYLGAERPLANPGAFLVETLTAAHQAVLDLQKAQALPATPGTTGVLCLVQGGTAYTAHVGDSRLYLFRDGLPLYRSRDHSFVEQLYRSGAITRAEADRHPKRHQITRCIGCQERAPRVELGRPLPLSPQDVLLLCSDGLWSALDDVQLGAMLTQDKLPAVIDRMAERAEQAAYPHSDNVSVIALRLITADAPREGAGESASNPATQESEQLRSAIEQIEQVFSEYEDELKR